MSRYAPPIQVEEHDPHACNDKTHSNCESVKAWWKINRALKIGRNVTLAGDTVIIHNFGETL